MTYHDHELALPDGVADEFHGAGVGAAGDDQGVGRASGGDESTLERLFFAGVHLEVFGPANQGQSEVGPLGVEHVPRLFHQVLDLAHWSVVTQTYIPFFTECVSSRM